MIQLTRAISRITRLSPALLVAGFTFGCSSDSESGGTLTGPATPPTGTATFVDRTTESGFGGLRLGPGLPNSDQFWIVGGAAAGDVDNDGDIDLFVVSHGSGENTLYVNQGDGTFSATLLAALANTPLFESGPLFVDYDGDGLLDLIMGGVRNPPDGNDPSQDADQLNSVRVYHNLGGLNFADVTTASGITPPLEQNTYSISAGDINGDQRLDLFLSHWRSSFFGVGGFLWRNDGGGAFTDITTEAGLDDLQRTYTFAANFSDIDGDADLDLLIASDLGTSTVLVNNGGVFSESTGSVLTDRYGDGSSRGRLRRRRGHGLVRIERS